MLLKRLEIFGFKSFADKTTLNFGPGITAIVGPNGCGKSNIFDAIRWVLGEHSVKELRGSAMEDVIFNGTDKKQALGFAEVSLTFSNESKMLPVAYDEVTVTRRLFRSGESEYLLNKTTVRLKDILELFMGTGIGAEAYSLVQQGRVDLVVSAKPEERRVILDEASGITKYKSKRREALAKLKDTENNLLRINDIVVEVKRQISSLERQAQKARRYKEEYEQLKKMEVQIAEKDIADCRQGCRDVQAEREAVSRKETQLSDELRELNDLVANESILLEELEDKINGIRGEDIKIDGQIDLNSRQISFCEERITNTLENEKRLLEQKSQLDERCRGQQEKISELERSLALIDETVEAKKSLLTVKRESLQAIAQEIEQSKVLIQEEEGKILGITSQQVHIKNRLTEVMKEVQGCLARKRRLEMENAKVNQEKETVDGKYVEICHKITAAEHHLGSLRGERELQNQTLATCAQQLEQLEEVIAELERRKFFLISQKEFIEKLCVQYQDIPDPVVTGRLLTDIRPQEHHTGIIGKVKEVAPVDDGLRGALGGRFSGEAKPLYEIVCETKFIELDPQQISAKILELAALGDAKSAERQTLLDHIAGERQMVSQTDAKIQEEEKVLSVFEAQKKDVQGEAGKLNEELDLVRLELDEVAASLEELKRTEEEMTGRLDGLNQEMAGCQIKIRERQNLIAVDSTRREETTVAIAQLETEVSSEQEKKASSAENLLVFSEALKNSREEITRIETERQELMAKKERFTVEMDELAVKIEELKGQKQTLRNSIADEERQKEEILQRLSGVRSNIASYATDIEQLKNEGHKLQLREQEITFKEKEIKDRLLQSYKIDFESYMQEMRQAALAAGSPAETPAVNREEQEVAIERLRKRCESFGAVNLVAIEEFDELKNRFEFLTKQQSDLITARESLMQTITKINRQTRQMFMDTFTKVSEEFRIYFRMLFGGGEAQLVLLDPENVLESGIEIIARPPGKKLQNISLLSGGEKTLTAIALIFGVFRVNPSPFCVLDEIDAALDESNVGRFSYLLKDFAKIAQFIVITHNKKTITAAQVMYGITMQETGVSKIVSVKFTDQDSHRIEDQQPVPAAV